MQTNSAKGPYLRAGVRPTKRSLLLGLRGRRGSHGLGPRIPPTRPEPPDPSVALSRVAGTQAQSGREEAVVAGRGGAGRGYLRRAPPGRGTWERLSRRTKAAGDGSPHPFLLGPAPELELVLDTLSGRWRGSLSEPGQDSTVTFGPGGRESTRPGP